MISSGKISTGRVLAYSCFLFSLYFSSVDKSQLMGKDSDLLLVLLLGEVKAKLCVVDCENNCSNYIFCSLTELMTMSKAIHYLFEQIEFELILNKL